MLLKSRITAIRLKPSRSIPSYGEDYSYHNYFLDVELGKW
jgi:hypothetical protein